MRDSSSAGKRAEWKEAMEEEEVDEEEDRRDCFVHDGGNGPVAMGLVVAAAC